jgi:hypothetical protein
MRLLRLAEVEQSPSDLVFRHSRFRALIFVSVALLGGLLLCYRAKTAGFTPGYYLAAVDLLGLALVSRFITARFRSSNWLLRMNDTGIFIQFRSYLNYHLPAEDVTVVFISCSEVRSAHLLKERVTVPDSEQRGTETQYLRYIELELAGDVGPLAKALDLETSEKAPMERRWYGRRPTLYGDHPVRMESPSVLQIRWQIVPSTKKFLDALRPYTMIGDPVSLGEDFAHLESLGRDQQLQRLRDLAQRGQTITAIYLARKLYGCGLAQAKDMVENISQTAETKS